MKSFFLMERNWKHCRYDDAPHGHAEVELDRLNNSFISLPEF